MIAKKIILVIAVTLTSLVTTAQTSGCTKFHTGSFIIESEEAGITKITRTENQQVEINEKFGYEVIFDLTWIDPCTYELRPKQLIKGDPAIMGEEGNMIKTRIKDITADGYTAETSANFSDFVMDFVVKVVK